MRGERGRDGAAAQSADAQGGEAQVVRLPRERAPTTEREDVPRYHSIGVGAGPANLSLAALFESIAPDEIALFERSPGPGWHNGMLHPGAQMQTGWIKDLVSLVAPQHHLSFLNYLVMTGRVYAFLSAQYESIPRVEYVRYLAWASERLGNVHYGAGIDRISFDDGFSVYAGDRLLARSDHLVLGLGTTPRVPAPFRDLDDGRVVMAEHLAGRAESLVTDADVRVAVVGGGQTGAECVLELLRVGVRDILWFGRRPWFATLEDSPAANDFYRPAYARLFPLLPAAARQHLVQEQALTSDGISVGTLRAIYQLNYEEALETGRPPVILLPGREVVRAEAHDEGLVMTCVGDCGTQSYHARSLVLAAGREPAPLPFDEELSALIEVDERGEPIVEKDFSIRWAGGSGHRLFAQNRGLFVHGLADKNLSLLAMRSAIIINALFEREVFAVRDDCVGTAWGPVSAAPVPAVRALPEAGERGRALLWPEEAAGSA
jgi:lysine N6-hydroxylase